jgi:hypothetical protein
MTTGYEVEGIEKRWAAFKAVPEIIDEKFEDGRAYARDALRMASETINRLSDIALSLRAIDTNMGSPLKDIDIPDLDEFVGEAPTTPTIEMHMPDDIDEVDEIGDAVHDKLVHDIQEGGPAISEEVEEAIFKRGTERDAILLNEALDKISSEWSKRGFTLPNGMLNAELGQQVIEYTNKRLDVSREISIKSFELGDTNTKFAIERGIQWIGSRIEIYKAKVSGEIARIDAIVKKYLGEVEVYKGKATVYSTLSDIQIKKFDTELKLGIAKADLTIKAAEVDMKNYELLNSLKIEALKAIGSINAQEVAGALSSVSAGVHMSVSNAGNYAYSTNPSY